MTTQNKSFFTRLLHTPLVNMLLPTMLGVIAGIYLTSYFEKQQLLHEKKLALQRVDQEISENEADLKKYHDVMKLKFNAFQSFVPWLNRDEEAVIIPKDSLDSFLELTKEIFTFSSAEPYQKNQLKLSGEMDMNIEPGSMIIFTGLSHVVWDSYKQKNFLSVTDFNCMAKLENLYKFQKDFDADNKEWINKFFGGRFMEDDTSTEQFLRLWNIFLLKQNLLLKVYAGGTNDLFQNCK